MVPGETPNEHLDLQELADQTAILLRSQMKALGRAIDKERGVYNAALAKEARDNAVALAKVLENARKLHKEGSAAVNRMSFAERVQLVLEWYQSLPVAHRRAVLKQFTDADARLGGPVKVVGGRE